MKILKTKDVPKLRAKWLKEQGNKDDILNESTNNPTLDHDHVTGYCRGVLDRDVNQFLGKLESAYKRYLKHKTKAPLPGILKWVANYLEHNKSTEEIIHPKDVSLRIKRFSRLNAEKQKKILSDNSLSTSEDKKSRINIYKNFLNSDIYKF